MRANEIYRLDELVNAPQQEIYHWTNAKGLRQILSSSTLVGNTDHDIAGKQVSGVSFSRNPFFDIQHTYAINGDRAWRIGVNVQRLRADHKLVPIRYGPYRDIARQRSISNASFLKPDFIDFSKTTSSDEMEEFCYGDVHPIWHYMSSLAVEARHIDVELHPEAFDDPDEAEGIDWCSRADQELVFDIMAGTLYGKKPYAQAWPDNKGRKALVRLPPALPFNIIERGNHKVVPFKTWANAQLERYKQGFPEKPDNARILPADMYSPERGERNKTFNQSAKKVVSGVQ